MTASYNCRGCNQQIVFDNSVKSSSGKVIPLNAFDKSRHDCPARQQNANTPASTATTPASPASQDPIRMTLLEFDTHIQNIARQVMQYLSELAPYSTIIVNFGKKEPKK